MSRPSPTPHEVAMAMRALRAGYDDVPEDIRPEEQDHAATAPVLKEEPAPPAPAPVEEKTSTAAAPSAQGSYKTRATTAKKDE